MMSMPRIGTELAGYRIESLIARGGMSIVYLAESPRMHNEVALKILAPELTEHEELRERFVRESRTAARINHPNIIPIYDAGSADGALYIAMRYVDGPDLKQLITERSPLSFDRIFMIMSQLAGALDAAHEEGLVHRDVKPGNVLIAPSHGESDFVYLTDFGVTKRIKGSGPTMTGDFLGTVDYMAPEQIEGKPIDGRADIYSLGCLLFETLTASLPFDRPTDTSVIWAHVNEEPRPPSAIRGDVPSAVDAVVAKAMAKNPDHRYATGAELIGDLRQALAGSLGTDSGPRTPLGADTEAGAIAPPSQTTAPGSVQRVDGGPGYTVVGGKADETTEGKASAKADLIGAGSPDGNEAPPGPPPSQEIPARRRSPLIAGISLLAALLLGGIGGALFIPFDETAPSDDLAMGGLDCSGGTVCERTFTHIPKRISPQDHCEATAPEEGAEALFTHDFLHGALPVRCQVSGITVVYGSPHSREAMFRVFDNRVITTDALTNGTMCDVPPQMHVVSRYDFEVGATAEQILHSEHRLTGVEGLKQFSRALLCYNNGQEWVIEWTDGRVPIYARASVPNTVDYETLYDWWRNDAGPDHPVLGGTTNDGMPAADEMG